MTVFEDCFRVFSSGLPLTCRRLSVVIAMALLMPAVATAGVAWHHRSSPFRAHLEVVSQPNHPRAGLAVAVPSCGFAQPAGKDLFAFDAQGNPLTLCGIGPGPANTVLAQVDAKPGVKDIFVYFGSKSPSPQNLTRFLAPLMVTVRSLPPGTSENWDEAAELLRQSRPFGSDFLDAIALTFNPVNGADACIFDIHGSLKVEKDGEDTFMLVSDDSGFLFIDEELLVARGGRHYANDAVRGESRGTITLTKGIHPIRCVIVEYGGGQVGVVARYIDGHTKKTLTADDFVQPGRTKLKAVEAANPDAPAPLFTYEAVSYMSYEDRPFTEVLLSTVNGKPAEWRFGDGGRAVGATTRRVFVDLVSRDVAVRQGKLEAAGRVDFPEIIPPQKRMNAGDSFARYTEMILAQPLRDMDPAVLNGYRFFLGYKEHNPDLLPVCEALLSQADVAPEQRRELLLEVARLTGGNDPDKAIRAYELALEGVLANTPKGERLWEELGVFLLFERGDPDSAERVFRQLAEARPDAPNYVSMLRFDLALMRGNVEEAKTLATAVRGSVEAGRGQHLAAVKSSALQQRFYDCMAGGFVELARDALQEWGELPSEDRFNGNWSLARARFYRRLGWLKAANAMLKGAILYDSLLPNLPDVELERAGILRQMGEMDQAREIAERISNEYPNHPAAQRARNMFK